MEGIELNFGTLQPAEPNSTNTAYDVLNGTRNPYLEILIQPEEFSRFRYSSEGGSHGCLEGRGSTNDHKTYPTVRLHNYHGEAIIKCQLYQYDKNEEHPHILKGDHRSEDTDQQRLPYNNSYDASFKQRWIMQIGIKNVFNEMRRRLERRLTPDEYQGLNLQQLRQDCKEIELYIVRLRFSAQDVASGQEICEPVYSEPVYDSRNPDTCELKIIRFSRCTGRPCGGEEILMFTERLPAGSQKIQVNFFEKCPETDEDIWRTAVPIMSYNIHRQLGIHFNTPPYKNREIKTKVKVYMELQRLKDRRRSAPREFTYIPSPSAKRSEPAPSCNSVAVQTTLTSIPSSPTEETQNEFDRDPDLDQFLTETFSQHQPVATGIDGPSSIGIRDPVLTGFNVQRPIAESMQTVSLPDQPPKTSQEPDQDYVSFNEMFDMSEYSSIFNCNDVGNPFQEDSGLLNLQKDSGLRQERETPETEYEIEEHCAYTSSVLEMLMQGISLLKKAKRQKWYREISMRLEVLLGIKPTGETILHKLITSHLTSFKYMVEVVSSLHLYHLLNAVNDDLHTILHLAVINEMPDIVPFLIEKGCNPAMRDVYGYTAIHQAVRYPASLEPLLNAIIKKGDDAKLQVILGSVYQEVNTPLYLAIELERLDCVQLLLEAGSDPLTSLRDGPSTIHLAILIGNLDILRIILAYIDESDLERAVNQTLPDCFRARANMTPLQFACTFANRENTLEVVQLLLEKQACPYQTHGLHKPAWQLAKRTPRLWAIMKHFVRSEHRGGDSTDDEDSYSYDSDSSDDEEFLSADEGEFQVMEKDISRTLETMRLSSGK